MQALTRNPLADPGLLGIDAGAAAAIVIAIAVLHLANPAEYVWFAFAGRGGRVGRRVPARLARPRRRDPRAAGARRDRVAAALTAFTNGVTLLDPLAFNDFRFWSVGALAGRDLSVLAAVGPFLRAGAVLALVLARPLNAIALGDDAGRALGARDRPDARARRDRGHAAVRRRDRRRRADRLRRAHGPPRRARDRRARPAARARLLGRASRRSC